MGEGNDSKSVEEAKRKWEKKRVAALIKQRKSLKKCPKLSGSELVM